MIKIQKSQNKIHNFYSNKKYNSKNKIHKMLIYRIIIYISKIQIFLNRNTRNVFKNVQTQSGPLIGLQTIRSLFTPERKDQHQNGLWIG